jgi:hypothetical protein
MIFEAMTITATPHPPPPMAYKYRQLPIFFHNV